MRSEQYDERKRQELTRRYPTAKRVTIITRGKGIPRCGDDEVQYIKATGGEWGKSSQTRIGANVAMWEYEGKYISMAVAATGYPPETFWVRGRGEVRINWSQKYRESHPDKVADLIGKLEAAGWRRLSVYEGWRSPDDAILAGE